MTVSVRMHAIVLTANWTPWFLATAAEDKGPVSDESQPILIACAEAALLAAAKQATIASLFESFVQQNFMNVSEVISIPPQTGSFFR